MVRNCNRNICKTTEENANELANYCLYHSQQYNSRQLAQPTSQQIYSIELDLEKPLYLVYWDFTNALDKVPNKRPLVKLRGLGMRGKQLLQIKGIFQIEFSVFMQVKTSRWFIMFLVSFRRVPYPNQYCFFCIQLHQYSGQSAARPHTPMK